MLFTSVVVRRYDSRSVQITEYKSILHATFISILKDFMLYTIHSNIAPVYLNDCLREYLVDNNYNLRNSSQYRVPRCSLETFSKSVFSVYNTVMEFIGTEF